VSGANGVLKLNDKVMVPQARVAVLSCPHVAWDGEKMRAYRTGGISSRRERRG
jgi:hypothetical protein